MKKKKKVAEKGRSLFERCDAFLERHDRIWFWILFGIMVIVSIQLYDPRISLGGDDSAYIVSACELLDEGKFPNYQGPLYPMLLSLIYLVFGMSLPAFKFFSLLSMAACLFFTFRAFRRRIPATLLFITLLFVVFNSHILYFASQTWNEAFYLLMQSLLLWVFFRFFMEKDAPALSSMAVERHCWLAATLLAVIMTRSIGYAMVVAVIGYFAVYRQWQNMARMLLCFVLFFGIYQLVKYLVWGDTGIQASGQASGLLNKDFYKPEYGREDFAGFLTRFWGNSRQYFSHAFVISGIYSGYNAEGLFMPAKAVYVVAVYLVGLAGIWFSYRRNKYLFFAGTAAGVFVVTSFLILQVSWSQYRLIVPAYPFMVLLLFAATYYLLSLPRLRSFQFLFFVPVVICLSGILDDTSKAIRQMDKVENEYSDLTPDWLHYAQASAWAAKHLPEDALVACRKPSISAIYGKGRKFYGLYRVTSGRFDNFYEQWKADSAAYFVIHTDQDFSDRMYQDMLGYCEARIMLHDNHFLVMRDSSRVKQLLSRWQDFPVISSPKELLPFIAQAEHRTAIYYPDSLLSPLREKNVTHILTANLRQNPKIKNGNIINTVERVASFIQEKYPTLFYPVKQFGEPDDEPAILYQIDWKQTVAP
ncbi:MAG: hypothetical protein LBS03_11205 [Bacteroidales bacterium]|jgi:hypothetical protein|nr:hypothetical protein [Bacteroidales bacterium]